MQNPFKKQNIFIIFSVIGLSFDKQALFFLLDNLYVHNYFVRLQNILELSLRNDSVVNNTKPWKMQLCLKNTEYM